MLIGSITRETPSHLSLGIFGIFIPFDFNILQCSLQFLSKCS